MRRKSLKKSKLTMIVEEVVGNDELLIEILLRLPPKSIFKCKFVSKRWNGIIAHPSFLESYRSRTSKQLLSGAERRLLAIIQDRHIRFPSTRPSRTILPVVQQDKQKFKPFPDCFGDVVQSSEGLFLCYDYRNRYYVVNPLTRKWIQLPPTPASIGGIGLTSKENTEELVPSFKVLGFVNKSGVEERSLDIQTYSYETGRWTTSTLIANEELRTSFLYLKVVCKGVFHWYSTTKYSIAVYNSNRDENCIHLINLPQGRPGNEYLAATRSSTDDLLWIATDYGRGKGVLDFWKLPVDDYDSYKCATTIPVDRWVLMHTVGSTSFYNEMSLVLKSKKRKFKETDSGSNRAITLVALIPCNPVAAVLHLQQKLFLYDLESQRLEFVQYRGRPYGESCIAGWVPVMDSLCLSAYGPFGSSYE